MRYLYVQKIPVIPLSALLGYLYKNTPLPDRAVVVTIDDGYRTAKTVAWPILAKYHFPFTLFVYPHAISRFGSALRWGDIREMASQGVDIECHSMTHPLLTHPHVAMSKAVYRTWLDGELIDSKKKLEEELGKPVPALAYPYGGYDQSILKLTKEAGYQAAFTCNDGDVDRASDPLHLSRRLVLRQTSLKSFSKFFKARPLAVGQMSPEDGERLKDLPGEIRAKILDFSQIVPGSAQVLVDKVMKHWTPVSVDSRNGDIRIPIPPNSRRGYYFVSLMAKDRANPALLREATWLFIVRGNASKK